MPRAGGIGNSTWPHMVARHRHTHTTHTHTHSCYVLPTAVITTSMCGLISLFPLSLSSLSLLSLLSLSPLLSLSLSLLSLSPSPRSLSLSPLSLPPLPLSLSLLSLSLSLSSPLSLSSGESSLQAAGMVYLQPWNQVQRVNELNVTVKHGKTHRETSVLPSYLLSKHLWMGR